MGQREPRRGIWALLFQASVIGVLVTIALTFLAIYAQGQFTRAQVNSERELAWRQRLTIDVKVPGADLRGLFLGGVYAPGADLSSTQGDRTVLRDATLTGARLDAADLTNADLEGAQLDGVSFVGANATSAKFNNASLRNSDFRFANVRDANFSGADIEGADFRGVDLSKARFDRLPRLACWDDQTRWPMGIAPSGRICPLDSGPTTGSLSERWSITVLVALPSNTPFRDWSPNIVVNGDRTFYALIEFRDIGRVPVQGVTILAQLGDSTGPLFVADPSSLQLVTANVPDGSIYPSTAIQDEGRQINVGIGNYGGDSNALVYVKLRVNQTRSDLSCGSHTLSLSAYASPFGRGAITDTATVAFTSARNCTS